MYLSFHGKDNIFGENFMVNIFNENICEIKLYFGTIAESLLAWEYYNSSII